MTSCRGRPGGGAWQEKTALVSRKLDTHTLPASLVQKRRNVYVLPRAWDGKNQQTCRERAEQRWRQAQGTQLEAREHGRLCVQGRSGLSDHTVRTWALIRSRRRVRPRLHGCRVPSHISRVRLCDSVALALQAPLSMGFPSKNTGGGCHFLLQGIFPTQGSDMSFFGLLHWQPPGKAPSVSALRLQTPSIESLRNLQHLREI